MVCVLGDGTDRRNALVTDSLERVDGPVMKLLRKCWHNDVRWNKIIIDWSKNRLEMPKDIDSKINKICALLSFAKLWSQKSELILEL